MWPRVVLGPRRQILRQWFTFRCGGARRDAGDDPVAPICELGVVGSRCVGVDQEEGVCCGR
jgi:hypothetical protein